MVGTVTEGGGFYVDGEFLIFPWLCDEFAASVYLTFHPSGPL